MYDVKSQLLIKKPINRYLINSPMLPSMKKNEDGSLTLIQKDSPGKAKEANWLPAPNDTIYLVMYRKPKVRWWAHWHDSLLIDRVGWLIEHFRGRPDHGADLGNVFPRSKNYQLLWSVWRGEEFPFSK